MHRYPPLAIPILSFSVLVHAMLCLHGTFGVITALVTTGAQLPFLYGGGSSSVGFVLNNSGKRLLSPKSRIFKLAVSILYASCAFGPSFQATAEQPKALSTLIEQHCASCHDSDTETALDLGSLDYKLERVATFAAWEKVFDRVSRGEMPPESEEQPDENERSVFLNLLHDALLKSSQMRQAKYGRAGPRRLTKLELGYTLQDLLQISGNVTSGVPEESESGSFDTVGATQRISALHMESFLGAADEALALAIQLGGNPYSSHKTTYGWLKEWHEKPLNDGGSITREHPEDEGIVLFRDIDYLTMFHFNYNPYGGVPTEGVYRLQAEVAPFQSQKSLTVKCIVKDPSGGARLLKAMDLKPGKKQSLEIETYLKSGEIPYLTYVDPSKDAIFSKGGARYYKGPGLAIHSQTVEGPLNKTWPPASTTNLLRGIELKRQGGLLRLFGGSKPFQTKLTQSTEEHIDEIVSQFARLAFRRSPSRDEIQPFLELAKPAIADKRPFLEVMQIPLRSMLGAPSFLLFDSEPGKLDDSALASRLSYFLWRSMPDAELFELADAGKLSDPKTLIAQVERMLDDDKSDRFVKDFVGQWLRLYKVNVTTPDEGLYPEFDELLSSSIPQETELFFSELVHENLSLCNLVDSDFTMLNRRLAEHYDIEGVEGQEFRRVELPGGSPRGGVLTHAAILKTTANGTNTSPVARGNFVLANLLGTPPPPPPPNIGSIEPDTRGRTTIREILAAHREMESCNQCHREIDPPGFALESFNPIGGFRTNYRISGGESSFFGFVSKLPPRKGPRVDSTGVTADGQHFADIQGYKKLLLRKKDQLARNFISQLIVFSTGAEIQFADRQEIERILTQHQRSDYSVRDIVLSVVQSKLFLNQ
ncbi:MAG: DUF1592 domain-containing protein [Planctomycetota bacterium]|nr:DUF1592 domain-containing protein [Planctomycetota bacterium]